MQKVSKQSLAMIALSILLAISIALTFTFAAMNDTKTVNGTITFSGNVAIQMGFGFEADGSNYKITLTANAAGITIPDAATIGLSSSSTDAYVRIVVSDLRGANATAGAVSVAAKSSVADYSISGKTFTSTAKISAGANVELADLIQFTVDLNELANDTAVTFTITVDANATNGGTWA